MVFIVLHILLLILLVFMCFSSIMCTLSKIGISSTGLYSDTILLQIPGMLDASGELLKKLKTVFDLIENKFALIQTQPSEFISPSNSFEEAKMLLVRLDYLELGVSDYKQFLQSVPKLPNQLGVISGLYLITLQKFESGFDSLRSAISQFIDE